MLTSLLSGRIRVKDNKPKKIFNSHGYHLVKYINGYLTGSQTSYISRRSSALSSYLPKITYGNLLNDGGNLILNKEEMNDLINHYPESSAFIRKFMGAQEFIKGMERWCLKIDDNQLETAKLIPPIQLRLDRVSEHRKKSTEKSTREMSQFPHRYYFFAHKDSTCLIVPSASSERREYIPIGFLGADTIVSNLAQAIYYAEPWVFGVITSRMHMTWVRTVAGRLKTDYRYSSALCYNTFPLPELSKKQKEEVTTDVLQIIDEREKHSEKTMAELYDLREAHRQLDLAIERIYRPKPFENDEERLEYLFKLYEEMIESEKKEIE